MNESVWKRLKRAYVRDDQISLTTEDVQELFKHGSIEDEVEEQIRLADTGCQHPPPHAIAKNNDIRDAFAATITKWCPVCGAVKSEDGRWLAPHRENE